MPAGAAILDLSQDDDDDARPPAPKRPMPADAAILDLCSDSDSDDDRGDYVATQG